MNKIIPEHIIEEFHNMTIQEFITWCLENNWEDELESLLYNLRCEVCEEQMNLRGY